MLYNGGAVFGRENSSEVDPRLTALVGFLKGACHMSFGAIHKYFRDVIGVRISRGLLGKLVGKVSASLQEPYEALLAMLPHEDRLNVDETGHKENGKRLRTWCFRAYLYTVYKISPSRGSDVLLEVLGTEFNGVLGCDYFNAYRKYMRLNESVLLQFCLSHLIRDVKFLVSHPDKRNQKHGKRLIADLRKLFGVLHRRDEYASDATFRRALEAAQADLVWDATMESPHTREALPLEERFHLTACSAPKLRAIPWTVTRFLRRLKQAVTWSFSRFIGKLTRSNGISMT